MNKKQKEVQEKVLGDEEKILKNLKSSYNRSLTDIKKTIKQQYDAISSLTEQINALEKGDPQRIILESMRQAKVYQKTYQESLKGQVSDILNKMKNNQYTSVSDYLDKCYTNGFVGTLYNIHDQGIPLMLPVNQNKVSKAVVLDSKISEGMYTRMGKDINKLKDRIRTEVTRSMINGDAWSVCSKRLNDVATIGLNNSMRIARTEGHRIQTTASMDAMYEAKDKGADVVKQWDATLDSSTRESHAMCDGEIRELDEPFSNGLMFAGDPDGAPEEVINCRCAVLERARWALDQDELDKLKERAEYFGLDKSENFNDFMNKYLGAVGENNDNISLDTDDDPLRPLTLAGAKRGEPMSFEDADNYHVNPNYGADRGYSINCQSCVPTFEARQRGYNVEVLPNTRGSVGDKLSRHTNYIWIDPTTGKAPEYINDVTATTPKKYLKFIQDTVKQGERYSIEFTWKGRRSSGHIVNLDRTSDGQLRIKDNQRGVGERSEYIGDEQVLFYLNRMKYTATVGGYKYSTVPDLLRIDNMLFNEDVAKGIMKAVK